MTKILNLDEFETPVDKTVVIRGQKYAFKPLSVRDFINNLKVIEDYAKREEVSVADYVEHMMSMVRQGFPDIPDDVLQGLTMDQLKALNEFVRARTEEDVTSGLGEEAPKN